MNQPSDYTIHVCPECKEQIDPEWGSCYRDDYYSVEVRVGDLPRLNSILARARMEQNAERRRREREAAHERAVYDRMEREWRVTAPPDQIRAYEEQRARSANTVEAMNSIMRKVYSDGRKELDRQSWLTTMHLTPEEQAAALEQQRQEDIERWQEVIDRFEREGPASVSFYTLRRARQNLENLTNQPQP